MHFSNFSDGNILNRIGFCDPQRAGAAAIPLPARRATSRIIMTWGNDFYLLWLDKSMTYSSACFNGTDELYRAQQNKYERILSKFTEKKSRCAGNRLRLGRLCRTRRRRQPPCHRPDHLAGPAQNSPPRDWAGPPTSSWKITA
jgi:hypothetical protein